MKSDAAEGEIELNIKPEFECAGTSKKGLVAQKIDEESTSTYFSPKKTRNFIKKNESSLAKKLEIAEATENKPQKRIMKIEEEATLTKKLEKAEATEKKKPHKRAIKEGTLETVKLEENAEATNTDESSPSKTKKEIKKYVYVENDHWQPVNWPATLEAIQEMRRNTPAPVDTMGCDKYSDDDGLDPRIKRYHCLVSLMLSSQTRDQANWDCMKRLIAHNGLTPENVVEMDVEVLEKLIYPVSFYKVRFIFFSNFFWPPIIRLQFVPNRLDLIASF